MRIGGELHHWEEGKCLIFDDAFEHEVFNDGTRERVVLLFDLWHWELSASERRSIEAMFRKVNEAGERRREREG